MHATVKCLLAALAALAALSVGGCAPRTAPTLEDQCHDVWLRMIDEASGTYGDTPATTLFEERGEVGGTYEEFMATCPSDAYFDGAFKDYMDRLIEETYGEELPPSKGTDEACIDATAALLEAKYRAPEVSSETLYAVTVRPSWPELGDGLGQFGLNCPAEEYTVPGLARYVGEAADKSGLTAGLTA